MNISPKTKEYAGRWLQLVPEFNPEYLELENAVKGFRKDDLQWQPLFAITVYSVIGNPVTEEFRSTMLPDQMKYLKHLHFNLGKIRPVRNLGGHGASVPEKERAKRVRELVLGTPTHLGLLKELIQLFPK